jgi:hypothetical protein
MKVLAREGNTPLIETQQNPSVRNGPVPLYPGGIRGGHENEAAALTAEAGRWQSRRVEECPT